MVRQPAVAGQFYEEDFHLLNKQIESCFHDKRGPGDLPVKRTDEKIKAVIVPHAGYQFSGPCAAWAYKEIAESEFPDAYLILGPNHFGIGSGMSIEDWKTPFGFVKTHKDIIRGLKENTDLKISEHNHITEHSIEVQLPFLQFANRDLIHQIRIIPVVVGNDIDYNIIGQQIKEYFKKLKKKIVVIVSTDFTHYGPGYGFVPFSSDIPKRITQLDNGAVELISKFDVEGLRSYINKTGITMCGFRSVLLFMKMIESADAHLLMHYTSGDLLEDYKNSVSYVSMVFK